MARLLACPFCRELFELGEHASCPHCDVPLERVEKLPPSYEVLAERALATQEIPPEDRTLPWTYWRRGRGALTVVACLGLAAFFAPWIDMVAPERIVWSGFDLARRKGGWYWGGAVAWFVAIPLALTRRTIVRMRGVRIAMAAFAGLTLVQVGVMLAFPPQKAGMVPVQFDWAWGIYAALGCAALGVALGARFGGRIDDLPADLGLDPKNPMNAFYAESGDGKTLH